MTTAETHTWRSGAPLRPSGRRTFTDLLAYCFPVGQLVSWDDSEDDVVVRFVADDPDTERIERLLTSAYRRIGPVHAQRTPLVDIVDDGRSTFGSPDTVAVGPGLGVGSPPMARLMRSIDDLALRAALELGAVELAVPHLVSWSTIERAGYARTFPQHLTACEIVATDLEVLDALAASDGTSIDPSYLAHAPVCISPSVCLHVFAAVTSRRDGVLVKPLLVTARAACGRYEGSGLSLPTRLWSFTMREIVYVGDRQGALDFRDTALEYLERLAKDLDVPCELVAANDPFFTTEQANLAAFQTGFDLKHELVGRLPNGGEVAVSSVNRHNQHFGTGFGITTADGEPASSACIGFGLERWAHWLHTRLGPDPANWPAVLQGRADPTGVTRKTEDTDSW
jgi:seryl-tRNA synthetase